MFRNFENMAPPNTSMAKYSAYLEITWELIRHGAGHSMMPAPTAVVSHAPVLTSTTILGTY